MIFHESKFEDMRDSTIIAHRSKSHHNKFRFILVKFQYINFEDHLKVIPYGKKSSAMGLIYLKMQSFRFPAVKISDTMIT